MSENHMNQQPQPQMQQAQSTTSTQQQNQDLVNCDLGNLESLNCNDSEELLRQLTENPFELDTFFSELSAADIKVWFANNFQIISNALKLFNLFQEENNNDVIDSTNQDNFSNCNDNLAILQNRLLSASSKFGINLIRGEWTTFDVICLNLSDQ